MNASPVKSIVAAMHPIEVYRVIKPDELTWRPSNLMSLDYPTDPTQLPPELKDPV